MFKPCDKPKQKPCYQGPPEEWTSVNGKTGNRVSRARLGNKVNVIEEIWRQKASNLLDGVADIATNPTADDKFIYNTAIQTDVAVPEGIITCTYRKNGQVKWRKLIKDYSGLSGDRSNAAPLVWGDYLFFGSSIQQPQTYSPYNGVMVNRFSGQPAPFTETQMRVYCVKKSDGSLVWEKKLGNKAQDINDLDNWATITQSPTLFYGCVDNTGIEVPFLVIGTSSLQSFQPWFLSRFGPFGSGPAWGEEYGSADGTPGFQCTDVGRTFYLDPFTGSEYAVTHALPEPLITGQVLDGDSLAQGQVNVITRHTVLTADVVGGGLNPVNSNFEGEGLITYVLEVGGTIPTPLDGIMVVDATNTEVTLVAGDPVTIDLNQVVVPLTAIFELGTNNVTINGVLFQTTDPNVGLDGTGVGLRPTRINKRSFIGDILDSETAYGLSYWGASFWNNAPNQIPCQSRIVLTNGQLHAVPYQDSIIMSGAAPSFIQSMESIKAAQEALELDPTEANFEALQQQYQLYVDAVESTIVYTEFLSARGQRAYFDSAIIVNVGPGVLGQIQDVARTTGYDQWQLGYTFGARSAFLPGWSDVRAYYERPAGGDADFGQGAYFYKTKCNTYAVLVPKGGIISVYDISSGSFGNLAFPKRIYGNPVIVGSSSFGSVLRGKYLTFNNSQAYNSANVSAPQPSVANYPPQLKWYTSKDEFYAVRQSSFATINILTGEYEQQRSIIEKPSNDPIFTVTQFFATRELLFIISGDGNLRIYSFEDNCKLLKSIPVMPENMIRRKRAGSDQHTIIKRGHSIEYAGIRSLSELKDVHSMVGRLDVNNKVIPGNEVKVVDVGHAGQSSVLVLKENNKETSVYVYSGRSRYNFYSNNNNYTPTEMVFCFRPNTKYC